MDTQANGDLKVAELDIQDLTVGRPDLIDGMVVHLHSCGADELELEISHFFSFSREDAVLCPSGSVWILSDGCVRFEDNGVAEGEHCSLLWRA